MKITEQTSGKLVAQIELGKSISWEFITFPILIGATCLCYSLYHLFVEQNAARGDAIFILLLGIFCLIISIFILNARFVVRSFIFDKVAGYLSVIDKGLLPFSQGGAMLQLKEIVKIEIGSEGATENNIEQKTSSKRDRYTIKLIRFSDSPVLIDNFYVNAKQIGSNNEVIRAEQVASSINTFLTPVQIDQEEADCGL